MRSIIDKPASTRKIYFWNMLGSFSNALSSVVFLMIVARTLTGEEEDTFSIAFSIAQLMYTIASFQVRVYQSTDVNEEYSFGDYFGFRIITSILMIFSTAGYVLLHGYSGMKAIIIITLCLYRLLDAIADDFEGLYQQKERLDIAGRFSSFRVVLSMIGFASILHITRNLLFGCIGIVVIYGLITILFAVRHTGQFLESNAKILEFRFASIKKMAISVFPIFLNGFMLMYIFNVPKNAIDSGLNMGVLPVGSQILYNILFMPASVINLMFIFFRPQITRMAVYYSEGSINSVNKTARRIGLILAGTTVFIVVAGVTIGLPILGFIYNKNLGDYKIEFMLILLGGGFSTLATLMDNLLTIVRKQHLNLISYGVSLAVALIIVNPLVNHYAIIGAAATYFCSMTLLFVFLWLSYYLVTKKR
jgi:O-antigen/teichoic acid export membrane protein